MNLRLALSCVLIAVCAPAFFAATAAGDTRSLGTDGTHAVQATGLSSQNAKDAQAALEKLAGVKAVTIDAEKGAITVAMKDDLVLKQSAVADALKPLGVQVTGFALPEGQEVVWMMTYSGGGG